MGLSSSTFRTVVICVFVVDAGTNYPDSRNPPADVENEQKIMRQLPEEEKRKIQEQIDVFKVGTFNNCTTLCMRDYAVVYACGCGVSPREMMFAQVTHVKGRRGIYGYMGVG